MTRTTNLRPQNPEDGLRRLLRRVDNHSTVPHGQKVATPDEGTTYYTSTGDALRWDGDTLAAYDSRISEGEKAVAQAKADLDEAGMGLDAARDRITAVEGQTTPDAIGSTAADQINSRRLIVGRDAILTGTVDVAQLNVTGDMAATIVRAMATETKRLIVTEDAILQRATVIENLVTPQLIAKRVDVQDLGAKLVTSGAIQTDAAANRGVKITSTGYKAYDAAGTLAVDLNGRDNLMIGTFSTNVAEKTGVRITGRGSLSAIDLFSADAGPTRQGTLNGAHGFMFFSSPGSLGSTNLAVGAIDRANGLVDSDPQIVFRPINKTISLMGQIDTLGSAFQAGQVTGGMIPGGGYVDATVTFPRPLTAGSRPMVFISPVSAIATELAYVITDDSTTGFKIRVVNKSANATSAVWIKWVAFAVGGIAA